MKFGRVSAEACLKSSDGFVSRKLFTHVLPLLFFTIAGTAGCGSDCRSYGSAGLGIQVEGPTGDPICDASVTISDGDYSEVLQVTERTGSDPCTFYGAYERQGSYSIQVEAAGFASVVKKATVDSGACRVDLTRLTIQL